MHVFQTNSKQYFSASSIVHNQTYFLFFAETLSTKMRCLTYKEQKLPELEFQYPQKLIE